MPVSMIYAQIGDPSPSDGSGTPIGAFRQFLDPFLNGAWGLILGIVIPAVLLAGAWFYFFGPFQGNSRNMSKGKAIILAVPAGLLMLKLAQITGNYIINHRFA